MVRTIATLVALAFLVSPAVADQCAWNSKTSADAASNILSKTKLIQEYCKSCGDKTATATTVSDVAVQPADPSNPDYFVVNVNGNEIDLAYAFVPDPEVKTKWVNLGLLAKCDEPANFDDQVLDPALVTH